MLCSTLLCVVAATPGVVVLRFTTPAYNAGDGSCDPPEPAYRITPDDLGAAVLYTHWGSGWYTSASHAALAPGAPDSFVVEAMAQVDSVAVEVSDLSGNVPGCRRAILLPHPLVDVPLNPSPHPAAAPDTTLYDLRGARVYRPLPAGIYWQRISGRRSSVRLVILR